MINLSYFEKFNETAIIFSHGFSHKAREIYKKYTKMFPTNNIFLINKNKIICAATFDKYESYIIIGIECPLHPFKNKVCYKTNVTEDEWERIIGFDGFIIFDSTILTEKRTKEIENHNNKYNKNDCNANDSKNIIQITTKDTKDTRVLVVSRNQEFFDYFNNIYEKAEKFYDEIIIKDRIKYLMKENMNANIIKNKKMFGIIYTSNVFEPTCNELHNKLNKMGRAYKIFLRDISYERLISIENIDCIVLVDCPLNDCDIRVHIPIVSPFSVSCSIRNEWTDNYKKNWVCEEEGWISKDEERIEGTDLKIISYAGELLMEKEYQGVQYRTGDEDMEIYKGKLGIASKYSTELIKQKECQELEFRTGNEDI